MELNDESIKKAILTNDLVFLTQYKDQYNIDYRFSDEDNDTLLLCSISDPTCNIYPFFIENKADVMLTNDEGENIIHSIVYSGLADRLDYLLKKVDITPLINRPTKDGVTPLLLAVLLKKDELFYRLLALGANVNLADNTGNTPLHRACQLGQLSMVKKLVEHGAKIDVKTKQGNYPLALAINADQEDIVKYLYEQAYG